MRLFHAARHRLGLLLGRRAAEARMNEEMRFHVDMEADRLVREQGLAPAEARRRAVIAFGIAEQHKDAMRDGRGTSWLDTVGTFALDFRLGVRMLAKYPGLSIVAVVGMAVAIAIGSGAFTFISSMTDRSLPLHEGERVVSIQNTSTKYGGSPDRQVLHDFAMWRGRVTRLRDLGAYSDDRRTLVLANGSADLVKVAHMTASGFRIARVAPFMGRTLIDDDEREGAPPVLVIAYEEWQHRFGGDPGIIGRSVKLGSADHTVIGVMPAGFRFPVNHRYWAPMRLDPGDYELGAGPQLYLFARLAPGVSIAEARAELATIGPAERERRPDLKPQVLPYTDPYFDLDEPGTAMMLYGMQAAITLLLVVVAVNVSVLVYARTAARTGEIAVRTALGATRRRVVGQLFAEALVLSGVAAAVGLAIAQAALTVVIGYMGKGDGPELPFWVDLGFSPGLALYVVGVAVLASVIVGVLPALQATGRNVHSGLKELSTRGSRMQLGRTWTTLIVAQVALAVAVLPYAGYIAAQGLQRGTAAARFPVDEIIRAEVTLQGDAPPPSMNAATYERTLDATFLHRAEELVRRLEAEPEVAGVTFASQFPGEELMDRVEAEGGATHNVRRSHVDVDMLGTMGVSMLAGRGLTASDVREDVREDVRDVARDTMRVDSRDEATVALVNPALAEWLGTTGSTLGRRIRVIRSVQDASGAWRDEVGSWLEVVGVMPDFTVQVDFDPTNAKLYIPTSLAGAVADGRSVSLAVRLRGGNAAAFAGRFRAVAADLDPALQLEDLRTAASLQWEAQVTLRLMGLAIAIVTLSVLLLSAAGIYAMMAFTVARRRREIGIRAALGADARRVLSGIFWRAGAQIGTGVLVGVLLAVALNQVVGNGMLIHDRVLAGERVLLLPMAAAIMLAIGLLAALGPARQGLRVQPTEALREE